MSGTSGDRAATSQVYSLRIPVDRLAELRQVAEADGVEPSALMRQWVLDRLDAEKAPCGEATDAELLGGKLDTARRLLDEVRQAVERLLADTGA
jgi:aryl-alcohol dehydrogenase-like predicted oxidoreductase